MKKLERHNDLEFKKQFKVVMGRRKKTKSRKLELITKFINVRTFHLLIFKIYKFFSKSRIREAKQH